MIDWKVELPGLRLGLGKCCDYDGDADLIFTDLYGSLPPQLFGKPAIINVAVPQRREAAEGWVGSPLIEVGAWGRRNRIYVANLHPRLVEIGDLIEDEITPGHGFFPLELPVRLLGAYAPPWTITVYDGCMGRGTVGRAVLELGHFYVGVDIDPRRVEMALAYLGCT